MSTADVLGFTEMNLKVYENLVEASRGTCDGVPECPMCRCCLQQQPASLCTHCQPTPKNPWGELTGLKALLAAMHEADLLDTFEDSRNIKWLATSSSSSCPSHQSSHCDREDGTGFGGDSADYKRLSRRQEVLRAKKLHQTLVLPRYVEILSSLGFLYEIQSTASIPLGHWSELRSNFFPLIRTWLRSSFFDLVGDSCLQVESKIRPTLQIFARWFQVVLSDSRQETALCSIIFLLFEPYEPDDSLTLSSALDMQVIVSLLSRLYEQAQSYLQKVGTCKDKYDRQTLLAWDLTRLYAMCHKVMELPLISSVWKAVNELCTIELNPCSNLRLKSSSSRGLRRDRDDTILNEKGETYEQVMAPVRVTASSKFRTHRWKYPTNHLPASAMRRIGAEFASLSSSLPLSEASSIFASSDETRMDLMKFAIVGPPNTPYQNGFFVFDVMLPPTYPWKAPQASLITTGNNTVRFNPNLYQDGYICLSLLGTWSGPGWDPQRSNLLQLLVSIQSLIFVSEPYFNEPGYDKLRGDPKSSSAALHYDARIRKETLRWAILEHLRNPPEGFEDCSKLHFCAKKDQIAIQLEEWESAAEYGYLDRSDVTRSCDEIRRRLNIPSRRKRRRRN